MPRLIPLIRDREGQFSCEHTSSHGADFLQSCRPPGRILQLSPEKRLVALGRNSKTGIDDPNLPVFCCYFSYRETSRRESRRPHRSSSLVVELTDIIPDNQTVLVNGTAVKSLSVTLAHGDTVALQPTTSQAATNIQYLYSVDFSDYADTQNTESTVAGAAIEAFAAASMLSSSSDEASLNSMVAYMSDLTNNSSSNQSIDRLPQMSLYTGDKNEAIDSSVVKKRQRLSIRSPSLTSISADGIDLVESAITFDELRSDKKQQHNATRGSSETKADAIKTDHNDCGSAAPTWMAQLSEECICAFCLEIQVRSTTLVPCGHSFCQKCVAAVSTCPTCRGQVHSRVPNRSLANMISTMASTVRTPNEFPETHLSPQSSVSFFQPDDVEAYRERMTSSQYASGPITANSAAAAQLPGPIANQQMQSQQTIFHQQHQIGYVWSSRGSVSAENTARRTSRSRHRQGNMFAGSHTASGNNDNRSGVTGGSLDDAIVIE